jgi:hypothetical protein
MKKEEKKQLIDEAGTGQPTEVQDPDFQFVLKALLNVYQPILEEELKRAQAPEELENEARQNPPNCDDEIALANRIFDKFFTEEVAVRLLPAEARELLGPIERWRWCLLHVRCCTIFGWLVCRYPRNFRSFVYYLYKYWICVRQMLGTPVSNPLTAEERQDFQTLVQALAGAYKPYLTDQLATVEFPIGIPDEVIGGKIDCFEGEAEAAAVFERFLTLQTAPALLGKAAFEAHVKEPFFWFCRCWCLCAIRYGCCLARARNSVEGVRCLIFYFSCLRDCFKPLRCEITKPTGCTEEEINQTVGGLVVSVGGTAEGAFFDHYTLEWRKVEGATCDDNSAWKSDGVFYPGGTVTGATPVTNGLLGLINTTGFFAGSYEVRVCIYSSQQGAPRQCCCIQFNLFKRIVFIDHVANQPVQTPLGPFVSSSPIVDFNPGGPIVSVGCCVYVRGSAFVGDCNDRHIKCFDLRYGIGFLPGPGELGFNPVDYIGSLLAPYGPVCYDEAGKLTQWNQVIGRNLTTRFVQTEIDLGGGIKIKVWKLHDFCFDSANLLPPCPDLNHQCRSGKYSLLLDVEDTLGNHYYDTQHVWFDNKPIHAEFGGLEGLQRCEDMSLNRFVPQGAPCTTCWPSKVLGIAYDEYIDYTDLSSPSDNFDYYTLRIIRQGGPSYDVPITKTLCPAMFGPDPFKGTQRVGDPGTRCEESIPGCPGLPHPAKFYDVLTQLDLRIFDDVCAPSLPAPFTPPVGFALKRRRSQTEPEDCCGYTFQLYTRDKTRSTSPAPCHEKWALPWAVCICNDLPPVER